MNKLQTIGIREFRENLAKYTREEQPLQVTSHGRAVGYFIPALSSNCVILCTHGKGEGQEEDRGPA